MLDAPLRTAAHGAWLAKCWAASRALGRARKNPAAAQAALLERLLRANTQCAYGRKFAFSRLRTVRDFQSSVPMVTYEQLKPWIERIQAGEMSVLTTEPVLMLEKTSGSSTAAKYIPYTASLRREFQRALGAWMFDLYRHYPDLLYGSDYWSITPLSREPEFTIGGLRVGFENDAEYFGTAERLLLRKMLAVPEEVARIPDLPTSIYVTLRFLVQAPSLAFISVWAPGFLALLVEHLQRNAAQLLRDLSHGTLRPPGALPPTIAPFLQRFLRANPARAGRLKHAWRQNGLLRTQDVWPNLRVISCWTEASSRLAVPQLQSLFPDIVIQGKGLLATEGIVSLPLVQYGACVPAMTSHLYEFIEQPGGPPLLLHQLQEDHQYSILITTGGGLYRYGLGDRVRVVGFAEDTPLLEFLGREDGVADLCGEKLSPAFVASVLDELSGQQAYSPDFAMLAPSRQENTGYVLFLQARISQTDLPARLDEKLKRNPHYAYCRKLGQLAPPRIFLIARDAAQCYLERCVSLGQRAGAVKPVALHHLTGWEDCFQGHYVEDYRAAEAHA